MAAHNNILDRPRAANFSTVFGDSLNELIQNQFVNRNRKANQEIPQDFLVNHVSGSFVEMVMWWIKSRMKQTPEELDRYFRAVIEPVL
ncbi:MAG: TetR-like C-terminal domain-containing protein [Clostridia bacterium]